MEGTTLAILIFFALAFLVYRFFKKSKEADIYTLFAMPKWIVFANTGSAGRCEKLSYSLLIQAGSILSRSGVFDLSEVREPMRKSLHLKKSIFITVLVKTAETIYQDTGELDVYRDSFERNEARVHLAKCIAKVMEYGFTLDELAEATINEPEFGNVNINFMMEIGRGFSDQST